MSELEHRLRIVRCLRGMFLRQIERLAITLRKKEEKTSRQVAGLKLNLSQRPNSS